MKILFTILMLLFININLSSQNSNNDLAMDSIVNSLVSKNEELAKNVDSLLKLNSTNIAELTKSNDKYQKEIKSSTNTINQLGTLIDSFGVIYTIITIVIALLAVVLPILIYLFGIKPSQKAIEKLENNIDERIDKYINEDRIKRVDTAVQQLSEQNIELRTQARTFLSLTHHNGFTDRQLFNLRNKLDDKDIDDITKGTIAFLLSVRKNKYADNLFTNEDFLKNIYIKNNLYQYFSKFEIDACAESLVKIITISKKPFEEFKSMILNFQGYNRASILNMLQNKSIVDALPKDLSKDNIEELRIVFQTISFDLDKYNDSYMGKIFPIKEK